MEQEQGGGHLRDQLLAAFGHTDLYEILQISPSVTSAAEIKKAYLKQALILHPDKGGDKDKFQALSIAHSILSSPEKRAAYDRDRTFSGDQEELGSEENFDFWYRYFRNLFPAINIQDIDDFSKEYIGSAEETRDILSSYERCAGDVSKAMEYVMFAEEGQEERVIAVIDKAIAEKAVKKYPAYTKKREELLSKVSARRDYAKGGKKSSSRGISTETLEEATKRKSKKQKQEEDHNELMLAMLTKRSNGGGESSKMLGKIFQKYGDEPDISDKDFEAARKRLNNADSTGSSNNSKKKASKI